MSNFARLLMPEGGPEKSTWTAVCVGCVSGGCGGGERKEGWLLLEVLRWKRRATVVEVPCSSASGFRTDLWKGWCGGASISPRASDRGCSEHERKLRGGDVWSAAVPDTHPNCARTCKESESLQSDRKVSVEPDLPGLVFG